ncbi:hypothetical protein NBRC116598_41460 [Pseudophaeobacter arcticus]|uniref:Uncharacterized protein n=1 Tax=Pseudophaeobacter arcticus TaxID=385492 RepID=A0ABQ0AS43_9RHOB
MQQSMEMNKLGPLWTFYRFVVAIRHIILIVSLGATVIYLLASETLEQRRYMLAEFGKAQAALAKPEAKFGKAGEVIFAGPSQDGRSISGTSAAALQEAARVLRAELLSAPAPNRDIELARHQYAGALADLLGKLNLFEPGADGTISVLTALEAVEAPAAAYHAAAEQYQTSVWTSFWAAF